MAKICDNDMIGNKIKFLYCTIILTTKFFFISIAFE